ncbi:MAG: glutamate--tRNA ligase [Ardenticatenaceae bacterium]|nr:glutamate--tRNA ligase [Anaerolineales bacterium]MCB8917703.1 glutamate--tRNA ligase [Ardenticatenaceae bacterium]
MNPDANRVPRLRFAPSPTGIPHIGNLHTALFCWALARALGGDFILRIEDTDQARNTPEAIQQMLAALAWLGIDWDEGPDVGGDYGPYVQSQRLERHLAVAKALLASGHAYYGDDPQHPAGANNQPLRLRMPRHGAIILHDALRGPIRFDSSHRPGREDPILLRSDGRPLYHLAAMTDDHDMGITHVVRGEEWISSTPIHIRLYQAMGWPQPVWVHLPLILNKRGEKLSKRDPEGGYLISDFQAAGYLPAALWNYLLLMGWSPDGEQEIIDKWTVRQQFRLARLSASPAVFDWDKLNWVNRQYMQRLDDEQLTGLLAPFLEEAYGTLPANTAWLRQLTALLRTELVRLADAVDLAEWAFVDTFDYVAEAQAALASPPAGIILPHLIAELAQTVLLDAATAGSILAGLRHRLGQPHGWNQRALFWPIRAALTGRVKGPPLADIMGLLGKQRCMARLAAAFQLTRQD